MKKIEFYEIMSILEEKEEFWDITTLLSLPNWEKLIMERIDVENEEPIEFDGFEYEEEIEEEEENRRQAINDIVLYIKKYAENQFKRRWVDKQPPAFLRAIKEAKDIDYIVIKYGNFITIREIIEMKEDDE